VPNLLPKCFTLLHVKEIEAEHPRAPDNLLFPSTSATERFRFVRKCPSRSTGNCAHMTPLQLDCHYGELVSVKCIVESWGVDINIASTFYVDPAYNITPGCISLGHDFHNRELYFEGREMGLWHTTTEIVYSLVEALLKLERSDPLLNVETISTSLKLILATDQFHLNNREEDVLVLAGAEILNNRTENAPYLSTAFDY